MDRDILLRKAIDKLCHFTVSLKVEQRDAVASLLDGHDVLAVLLTGFGKSLIFQVFVIAAEWNESDFSSQGFRLIIRLPSTSIQHS